MIQSIAVSSIVVPCTSDPNLVFDADELPRPGPRKTKRGHWSESADLQRVRAWCHDCPIQRECLKAGLSDPDSTGIWGGLTTQERRAEVRKQSAAWSKYYAMLGWDEMLGAPTAFVGVLGIELSSRQMLHWWLPAAVDQSRRWRERAGALRATLLDRSEVAEDVAAQMLQQWQQEAGTLALVSLQPLEEALNRGVMRSAVDLVLSSYGSMAWT